jgi:hypothetical protein
MTPERPGPMVEVDWIDSATKHGWHDKSDLPEPGDMPCLSIGYLVEDGDDRLVLVFGIGQNEYLCSQLIPKSAVQKVTRLRR